MKLNIKEVKNMEKELIILIIAPIVCFMWFNYLDKRREKKDKEQLSKRLERGY
jgi:preprotein translocase subunit YajC|tara:strand:- start:828 stop:986 length:159 start_codon:yes stop_codon:yes gene_type:complete